MAFNSDIERFAGSISNTVGDWKEFTLTTKADSWFVESIKYIVNRVKQTDPSQLWKFTDTRSGVSVVAGTPDGKGSEYAVFNNAEYGEVLHVYKQDATSNKRYMSRPVDRMIEPYLGDTNSIHYATKESPSHYIAGDNIVVYPSHSSGAAGFIQVRYDIAVDVDADSDISYFPRELYILPILHTSVEIIKYKLSAMRNRLPDVPDYNEYTGDTATTSDAASSKYEEGWKSVKFYIESEEDTELASAKMQELTAEQQLFVTDYQWLQGQLQLTQQEFEQRFAAAFGVVGGQ